MVPHTGPVFATIGLFPDLKSMTIFTGSPDERITHDMFNKNVFTSAQNGYMRQHMTAYAFAEKYPDITTWTGCIPDVAAGRDGWAALVRALKDEYPKVAKLEPKFIDPQVAKAGNTDFKSQISQLSTTSAEGFWISEYGSDGITFYQQARQFGLPKHFKAMGDYGADIFLPIALKRDVPPNVWSTMYWYYGAFPDNPHTKEVMAAAKALGNPYSSGFTVLGHLGIMAYAMAIKETGSSDIEKVGSYLEGGTWETLNGTGHFRKEDHQIIAKQNLVHWQPTDEEPGWKAGEFITVDDNDVVPPPNPGKKWED